MPCALVGGCHAKTRVLSFAGLRQLGPFESWRLDGRGCIPAEGAAFLVLEEQQRAAQRGAGVYATVCDYKIRSSGGDVTASSTLSTIVSNLEIAGCSTAIAAGDGDAGLSGAERRALDRAGCRPETFLRPKAHLGNLFAAAAAVQVALAAESLRRQTNGQHALANCFGHGSEQAAFLLEAT